MSQIFENNKRIAKNTLLLYDRMLFIIIKDPMLNAKRVAKYFLKYLKAD